MADVRWPALRRWSMLYRGSPRVDEALDLLRENDYDTLLARTSKLIAGRLTWARVAAVAVGQLARVFLLGEADRAASYAEDARALADRLRDRDAHPTARVTTQLRTQIGQLDAVARCIQAAVALRDGAEADDEALWRLAGLRTRWYALSREHASLASDAEWVRDLVQTAAGRVLSSAAGAGAKAVASRAVAAWLPADASADAPRATTRLGMDGDGVQVQWTDADDDLF